MGHKFSFSTIPTGGEKSPITNHNRRSFKWLYRGNRNAKSLIAHYLLPVFTCWGRPASEGLASKEASAKEPDFLTTDPLDLPADIKEITTITSDG